MGRFETIKPTGGSVSFQYKYDAASNEVERDNLLTNVNQFYSRDNLSRMTERDVKLSSSVISTEVYGYDSMSRLTSTARENGLGDTFTYYLDSEIKDATYAQPTPTPAGTPTPTPANQCKPVTFSASGGGTTALYVYLASATTGATIFYTVSNVDYVTPTHNGLTPLSPTFKYTGTPISVLRGQEKFIQAVAYKSGMVDSIFTQYDAINAGGTFAPMAVFNPAPHAANYVFDRAGNRTSVVDTGVTTAYFRNTLNQYTAVGSDAVTNGTNHELTAYQGNNYGYINDERLWQITSTGNSYQLYYDALGRCVKRTLNNVATYYIYDREKPILEYNAAGTLITKNLYGKGIDEILQRIDSSASPTLTNYYQDDHEGSVTQITDSTGSVVESYRYDVYGAPNIKDNSGTDLNGVSAKRNRFMFTGREYTATFGMYEYRARAYHPWLGRFMSEDPKGFVHGAGLGAEPDKWTFFAHPDDGELNLFRYCGNDPVDYADPTGRDTYEQNRDLSVFGARWVSNSDPLSHTFVFTTTPDGSLAHTYSWGNTANTRGWNIDQREDIDAASKAIKQSNRLNKIGDRSLDPFVHDAYQEMNRKENEHRNGWFRNNCKTEARKLLDKAQQLKTEKQDTEKQSR